MKKTILFTLIQFLLFYTFAQKNNKIVEDSAVMKLYEVVIIAQKINQKNILIPYSVNFVTHKEITNFQNRTTPEALMQMNGVFVQKTNHGGGSPFLRGLTGNQLLFLVDGIRLNNATFRFGPNQYLNTIDVYTINKIEVAKSTGSVQYGTDAMGGVINVITTNPGFSELKNTFKSKIISKYTSGNMEKTVRAEAGISQKKFALIAGITKRNFGDLIGGDTTQKQIPTGYNEWCFDVKAKFLLNKNIQLTFANQFLQQNNVPIYHKLKLENFKLNEISLQQRSLTYVRLQSKTNSKLFKEIENTLSFQQTNENRTNQKNGSTTLRNENDAVKTFGFITNILSEINSNWKVNSGLEVYKDNVKSKIIDVNTQTNISNLKRGLYPNKATMANYSIYTLHQYNYANWILDFGLRYNTFAIKIADTSIGNIVIKPNALVTNAALLYRISKKNSIYASYSSGFRAPNIDDLGTLGIVDFRYELPSKNLAPEKAKQIEIGYKLQTPKISFTNALYYMHITNLITRVKTVGQVISGYPVYTKENTEVAYIKGIESEIDYKLTKHIVLKSAASYTYGQNLTKNEPLRRIPPFNGKFSGQYNLGKWFVCSELQFASLQSRLAQGDKDDNRIPIGGTPRWNIINFYGGFKTNIIETNINLQNITNKDYRTHGSGINGMGRSVSISIILKL
jgi:hemoglobin/transferrin/lactoferrin receptor protein